MLSHLSIRNFAVVKSLDVDFSQGMTAITGETGAGKSIAIDALGLCLGNRAEAGMVRQGEKKAEISAVFDISNLPHASQWLNQQEFDADSDCLIRRVISSEGRSKAFINGIPVALQQLKSLGQHLLAIHSQHAHHQLLKIEYQQQLIDTFARHQPLLESTQHTFTQWQNCKKQLQQLLKAQAQRTDRKQLLQYQVQELDEFGLQQDEFSTLEVEFKRLSNGQTLLEQAQLSFHQIYDADFNALSAVQQSVERLTELQEHDASLSPIVELLNEASINIDEAGQQLRAYTEDLEIDPLRMQQVEARYAQAMDLSRKHQVSPEQLYDCHQNLAQELTSLNADEDKLGTLEALQSQLAQQYYQSAQKLSQSRQKAANKLSTEVQHSIRQMNMPHAEFSIQVEYLEQSAATETGMDEIQFFITTNPGQPADSLDKVLSGGELSRVGLAIQVICTELNQVPTLIFDEVDTGISGATASIVGKLLRTLGEKAQVLCVTHLPQVAARGHQQMFVTKFSDKNTTETHMFCLSEKERIEELARLLAGDTLTDSAIANAKALLTGS